MSQDEDEGGKSVDDQRNTDQGRGRRSSQKVSCFFGYRGEKAEVDCSSKADQKKNGYPAFTVAYLFLEVADVIVNFLAAQVRVW